jgi:VWFA-related protein
LYRLICSLLLTFSELLISASAQTAGQPNLPGIHLIAPAVTIAKQVDEVNLAFTVTDHRGRFISNLRPQDFRLLDNRRVAQQLTFFQQRSDLPLHIAIVIDASASVKQRYEMERKAVLAFTRKVVRPGKDRVFVVAFNDRVATIQEATDRTAALSKAMARVKPGGNTDLYGAVIYASQKLRQIPETGITRRAIVLVSDGVDTVGRSTLTQAQEAVARADVMIFSLTTNMSDFDPNAEGDDILKGLAVATGGRLLPAYDEWRLSSAFQGLERALRNQYVVAYKPPDFHADGSYHKVEVLPAKKGLRTNCRAGYYALAHATAPSHP